MNFEDKYEAYEARNEAQKAAKKIKKKILMIVQDQD